MLLDSIGHFPLIQWKEDIAETSFHQIFYLNLLQLELHIQLCFSDRHHWLFQREFDSVQNLSPKHIYFIDFITLVNTTIGIITCKCFPTALYSMAKHDTCFLFEMHLLKGVPGMLLFHTLTCSCLLKRWKEASAFAFSCFFSCTLSLLF